MHQSQIIQLIYYILLTYSIECRQSVWQNFFDNYNTAISKSPITDTKKFLYEYDFIIVGAGSGGSVLANRLTEERNWKVLLLESGKEESVITDIPISSAVTGITGYNWGYRSEPVENSCRGLEYGVCNWPKGRALGGSSVVNFLIYTRGNARDYDEWEEAGNYGWGWKDVLYYYKKLENVKIPEFRQSKYRGNNGPLDIELAGFKTPLLDAFFQAGREFGYPVNDPNGESQIGFSQCQATMRLGRRCSASKAYIRPAAKRSNLHISIKSWVTKVVIDPNTKTAIGVEFLKNNRKYFIKAKKEVILAAGAIGSPHLLLLSGVGPADHLQEFDIPVIQNLKVGHNMQDHNSLSSLTFLVNQPVTVSDSTAQNPLNIADYWFNGKGPLTLPGGGEGIAFIKTNFSFLPPEVPDIELVMGPGSLNGDTYGALRKLLGFTDEFYHKVYKDVIEKPAFGMVPVLMRPKSRGYMKLKSKNPFSWPIMQPNYYQHPDDMKIMLQGVKMAVAVAESHPFQRYNAHLLPKAYPGCEHVQFRSDDYWKCLLINYGSSLQHQSGTCKMGPSSDPDAVVNPELQVYGIKGLRVVDASIIPTLPASHTNAVVFMIGEKAADLVKQFWKGQNTTYYDVPDYQNKFIEHTNINTNKINYNFNDSNNNVRRSFGMNIVILWIIYFCQPIYGQALLANIFENIISMMPNRKVREVQGNFKKQYDFIIIGAGSGGSVLANRLSEIHDWNILLLEAGKMESPITDIPISAAMMQTTGYNWGYKSDFIESECKFLEGGVCNLPQGRALGGTSVINFLIHTRGNRRDYDEWGQLGNAGWSYNDVLPYFKKLESTQIQSKIDLKYRGMHGPVTIENPNFKSKILSSFLETGQQMGYKINDPNAKEQLGFSRAQATMKNGGRCSAAKAYLVPIVNRTNLDISSKSWVTKILIDPSLNKAIGVEFIKNKRKIIVKAQKEVLLSAGAISSPHLLMLSGIGPAENLKKFQIPVIKNLMVGFNHQDHIYMPGLTFRVNSSVTLNGNEAQNPVNVFNYMFRGEGPLTLPGGAEGIAFIKTNISFIASDQPDIEIVMGPGGVNGDDFGVLRKLAGLTYEFQKRYFGKIINKPAFGLVPVLLKPQSKGRIKLKSKNPFKWPSIKLNLLENKNDIVILIQGIREAIKIGESTPFKKYNSTFWRQQHPGCEKFIFDSDEYWACAIRGYASSLHHHSGTCKMGPITDRESVVNHELKVHGIEGLRVVDASIFPKIPASHTNSIVFMVGEKAADMIKNQNA
uniref:CSON015437 protein n=1 Tax=Culicoides sonorensis TaxID=179676 RepID=A0A336K688_CULSO